MKTVKLKKSILVKETKPGVMLVLDCNKDMIHQVTQDGATVLAILFKSRSQKGVPIDELQVKLAKASSAFRKYKHQREGLTGLLRLLQKNGLLETRS
jgi:hypothetical protein